MKNNPLSAASDNSQRETFTLMLSLHGREFSNLSLVTPVENDSHSCTAPIFSTSSLQAVH